MSNLLERSTAIIKRIRLFSENVSLTPEQNDELGNIAVAVHQLCCDANQATGNNDLQRRIGDYLGWADQTDKDRYSQAHEAADIIRALLADREAAPQEGRDERAAFEAFWEKHKREYSAPMAIETRAWIIWQAATQGNK